MEINRIYSAVTALADYGVAKKLLPERDRTYTVNLIIERLKLDSYEPADTAEFRNEAGDYRLEDILKCLLDYAAEAGLLEDNTTVYRDLFDTALMNCLLPRPSEVTDRFFELYAESPKKATDYYYELSRNSDYIRTYRVAKDLKWNAETEFGEMTITINLSKPEKDPKAIAAALKAKQSAYPKCQLCAENEGYAGRVNHPARENHRIIPITINKTPFYLQYSPYVYYNEHCIVFNKEHTPMKVDHAAFDKLLDFIGQFPHYCVGSNADLPIVGGSILTHDHFQGGHYIFPMAKAGIERQVTIRGFEDVEAGIVKWPMTVIRISSADPARLADCADHVLGCWRAYTDEEAFIYAETDGQPHNTITPIARLRGGETGDWENASAAERIANGAKYELDLVLRNNITTAEHPLGVYHPHAELHHIKKENIGLIEVMGLAILPARLKTELAAVRDAITSGADLRADETLAKHADWVEEFSRKYSAAELKDPARVDEILRNEVGLVYAQILGQCAVFKRDETGRKQLMKFIESL